MIGGGIQHVMCSSALNDTKYIEWVKDGSADVSFYIDDGLNMKPNSRTKNYGWLLESSTIIPGIIQKVLNNLDYYKENFECIFTHDRRIVEQDDFFKYTITNAMPWIQNREIYTKTKDVSVIVSNKKGRRGYDFRLNYMNNLIEKGVDHYGRGFKNELPWTYEYNGVEESGKLIGLKDYRFSFAFENENYPSIFCEKLTDCFATGTIPIFWGTPDIGDLFDTDGIIMFDENLDIESLNEELYLSKMDSIKRNFQLALELPSAEDYIYLNYFK